MLRILSIILLFLSALPASAQSLFADPTVWGSVGSGLLPDDDLSRYGNRDEIVHHVGVSVASRGWLVQGGVQVSAEKDAPFWFRRLTAGGEGGFDDRARGPYEVATYRSVYATAGPQASSRWFMAGFTAGPAVTWGTRQRSVSPCVDGAEVCPAILILENDRYLNLGLAGSVQGFVRLDGRLWVGAETMAVVNTSSTHLATRLALRVDLLRPDR